MILRKSLQLARRFRRGIEVRRLHRLIERAPADNVFLHLGCGGRLFDGWINIDLMSMGPRPDVLLDLSQGLPAADHSVDRIYSEDFLEHITRDSGRRLLADCYRVLKPGGVMRLLTPDLKQFVQKYIERNENTLAWYRDQFGCRTFGEMLNAGLREWGHQFVYDEETLLERLTEIGFEVRKRSFGKSDEPLFQNRDSRNSAEGSLSLYLDCYRV